MSEDPHYSLICAVRSGEVETAKTLIDTFGLSYSKAWSRGYVLLRDALKNGHEEVAKLLLKRGSKVNSSNSRTETPLHFAVMRGYTDIISMLLDKNANVNAMGIDCGTPLHRAVKCKSLKIVQLLLNHAACVVDARSMNEVTSFQLAVQLNHLTIAEELLNHGAQVNAHYTSMFGHINYTPLSYAVEHGNESMIKFLLSKGAEINATTVQKKTPLHVATQLKQEKIVKLLLEKGANVDACDIDGKSVLYVAVESGHLTTIEHILHFRPDVNSEANRKSLHAAIKLHNMRPEIYDPLIHYGYTIGPEDIKDASLLHVAVERGYVKIIETLLKLGADVNTLNDTQTGLTLLHSAVRSRQFEIAEMLLRYGANSEAKDNKQKQPIFYAIENNDANITKLLWNNGNGIEEATKCLFDAVKKKNRKIVEMLLQLEPKIDINARDEHGRTVLHYTALNDGRHFCPVLSWISDEEWIDTGSELAKMFLSRGACVNAKAENGTTALHLAAKRGDVKVVELLLKMKADVNALAEHFTTPLHFAVKRDDESIAKVLLDCGANVNARQKNGTTALHLAAKEGGIMVVELLLKMKADVNALAEDLTTPLHLAVKSENESIVKMLLDYGANVNARQESGTTAFHIAIRKYFKQIAKLLVERGADVNAVDAEKSLPLHLATVCGCHDVVNTLLEHDANVEAKDELGRTALHIAAKDARPMITKVLLEYGANINVICKEYLTPLNVCKERKNALFESFRNDYRERPREQVAKILEYQIVAMKALGLYVSDKNLGAVDLEHEHRDILEHCQMEVANMKIKKLGNSNVSFYDILTRDMNQLAGYARNKSIVEDLESIDFQCDFPSYRGVITRRFKEGQERESLLNSSLNSLNALFGYVFPNVFAIKLFNYLSNNDLKNLIKADPSAAHSDS